eukprot:6132946-Pyramimonas_sp.AAC.1
MDSWGNTMAGTPLFMPPEMLNGQSYQLNGDVYSLGCLLYMLCMHKTPYEANCMEDLVVSALL